MKDLNLENGTIYDGSADSESESAAIKQFEAIKLSSSEGLRITQRRIIIGFIIVLCMSLALGVFAISISNKATEDIDYMYKGPLSVQFHAQQMDIQVLKVYVAMRNLALSDADDRDKIQANISEAEENLSSAYRTFAILRSLTADSDVLHPDFNELYSLLNEYYIVRLRAQEYALAGKMEECRNTIIQHGNPLVEEINDSLMNIIDKATNTASEYHENTVAVSKRHDAYAVFFTSFILIVGLAVTLFVKNHLGKALGLVSESQREQEKILNELEVMDDRLRKNISELRREGEMIEHMAYHDAITKLPNRTLFIDRLQEALFVARENMTVGCVLLIDLDNFKVINDSHGHDFGDKVLRAAARRIRDRLDEQIVVARFGGDEFLVLLEDITDKEQILSCIEKIMAALSEPVSVEDNLLYVSASIGVTVFPEDGKDVNQLLKNADSAMYESKYAGRNTYAFYNKSMSDKVIRKSAVGDILRTAIEQDMVYMVFQPQYHPTLCRVVGFEALMRIRDESIGHINPVEFIPIAEETRLIIPLGYWAIRKAIETDLELCQQGIDFDYMSVNISEIQLRERDFVDRVREIIEEYDYDATRMHFEITETIFLNDLEKKIYIFEELRELGVKIELDDFGTGYSSLNYVRLIPLDVIKIDKCFIDEIGINGEKESLIDLIIRLAGTFETHVVAEGVETEEQLEFLLQKGDVIIQGFYYSKPLEAKYLPEMVNRLNNPKTNPEA